MTWQGIVFEPEGVERILVITAPTALAAKRELLRKARGFGWTELRTEIYEIRATHSWHVDTWSRNADGTVNR